MNQSAKTLLHYAVVLLGLSVLLFAYKPIFLTYFGTRFIGGVDGDAGLYIWLVRAFIENPAQALAYETPAMYPYPLTRAWSDNFLLPSALCYALTACGISLEIAYNTVIVSALILNGVCTYHFCRSLGGSALASFGAGALLMNSSYLSGNLGHPQLVFFFWLPLAWSFALTPRLSFWCLLRICLCISGAFFCAVYFAVFAVIGLVLLGLLNWSKWVRAVTIRSLAAAFLGAFVGLAPLITSIQPYLLVKSAFGARHLFEGHYFAASGLSYLAYSSFNSLFGKTSMWTHAEATLCPGYALLAFIAISVFLLPSSRPLWIRVGLFAVGMGTALASNVVDTGNASELIANVGLWIFLLCMLYVCRSISVGWRAILTLTTLFLVLSFGPGGNPAKGEPSFAPFTLLFHFMPAMDSVRASGRLGIVVVFGVYVIAALTFDLWRARFKSGAISLAGILLLIVTSLENQVSAFPFDEFLPRPQIFDVLQRENAALDAVVVLPFSTGTLNGSIKSWGSFATLHTRYMNWAIGTGGPLVNGYSGQRSKLQEDLAAALAQFPSERGLHELARVCGARFIVIVPSLYPNWNEKEFQSLLSGHSPALSLIARDNDQNLLLKFDGKRPTSGDSESPYFIPDAVAATISVASQQAEDCNLQGTEWLRDDEGRLLKYPVWSSALGLAGFSRSTSSLKPYDGLPFVFSLHSVDCQVELACSVHPSAPGS